MIHWFRFFRIPLLPTVWSHLFAAGLIADKNIFDHPWLIVAFSTVYLFGMGDNDRVDLPSDLEHNPDRPLASGALSLTAANSMLIAILFVGLGAVLMIDDKHQSMMVGCSLVGAWAYNRKFKKWALPGALCMGVARGSIYYSFLDPSEWKYAAVLAGYTVFVTLWSTTEDKNPSRKKWTLIFLLMLPVLDFLMVTWAKGPIQQAIFFFVVPVICRMLVLSLMPKKKNA